MLREKPGNVVVLSGRNRGKIDSVLASVEAGLNVLADKPWLIAAADLPKLERALDTAERKGLVAYDVMTERYEITTILQKALANAPDVVGTIPAGSEQEPAIEMESVHHLMKVVAGAVNLRPAWFFDTEEQGEGLADVATHLADLVPWLLFPEQAIDYRSELQVLSARRWPTVLDRAQLQRLTGERAAARHRWRRRSRTGSSTTSRTARCRTRCAVATRVCACCGTTRRPRAGATRTARSFGAAAPGSRSCRGQSRDGGPSSTSCRSGSRMDRRCAARSSGGSPCSRRPGPGWLSRTKANGCGSRIPDRYRVGHEAHFAEVTERFLAHVEDPTSLPAWEKPNMLAKYFLTTRAVELSR